MSKVLHYYHDPHPYYDQNVLVIGGKNSAGVAKILKQFFKDKQKVEVKAGVLSKKLISSKDVALLADMPSLDVLRAQLLGLVNKPASMFVRVINAVPQGLVNVLQAKVRAVDARFTSAPPRMPTMAAAICAQRCQWHISHGAMPPRY